MRFSSGRVVAALVVGSLSLSACGGAPADHAALVTALSSQGQMTEDQATCVADEIYDNSGYTEDQLKEAAKDISSVGGFSDDVQAAIDSCVNN